MLFSFGTPDYFGLKSGSGAKRKNSISQLALGWGSTKWTQNKLSFRDNAFKSGERGCFIYIIYIFYLRLHLHYLLRIKEGNSK